MVGAEPTALEKGGLERGREGQGTVEDADGALAADAPLVAVEAERDAGPGEHVRQDLAGPGLDLDPVGKDSTVKGVSLIGFSVTRTAPS